MQSQTYKDIIDDKIAEWQSSLKKLEGLAEDTTSDLREKLQSKTGELRLAIEAAIVQLRQLDEQETVANTIETKDKILKVFSSIDQDFQGYESKTPFML